MGIVVSCLQAFDERFEVAFLAIPVDAAPFSI